MGTNKKWTVEKFETDSSGRACFRINAGEKLNNSELNAKAKLIDSAPILLEALINLTKSSFDGRGLEKDRAKAQEAIKKATE